MVKDRIKQCLATLKRLKIDALLISSSPNIQYLTGFDKNEGGYLILTPEKNIYLSNFLVYQEAKKNPLWEVKFVDINENIFERITQEVKSLKIKRLGFEAKKMSFLEYRYIKRKLAQRGVEFIRTVDIIEDLRTIKTEKEIKYIKKATQITLESFAFIKEIITNNISERKVAIELERFLKIKSEGLGFSPIVAFGKNSSFVHHKPKNTHLKNKDVILVDVGAKFRGYCADLTRVFFSDKMPSSLKKIYEVLKSIQEECIRKIKPGVKIKEIDKIARELMAKRGWEKYFGHGLGHGIGIEVHEKPFIGPKNSEYFQENMVVTIEPGVYFPNRFGMRIESVVWIKKDKPEVLDGFIYS